MDGQRFLKIPKQFDGAVSFASKPTHSAFLELVFRPMDMDRATIPGITVEIVLRTGLTADRCKYTFTLFWLSHQKKRRVYQLEVVPKDKRSHNARPPIYGPHEHFGDGDDVRPMQEPFCCSDYKEWLNIFCQRINLRLGSELPYPFGDDHGMQLVD